MPDNNERVTLKTLVQFRAPTSVSLSLSANGRWLAYGDGESFFIGRWKNRSPHLTNVKRGPAVANLQLLKWSPDSRHLLASSDRVIYFVKPENETNAISFEGLEELGIETIVWSYDSTFVIAVDSCRTTTAILGIDGVVQWLPGVRMVDKKPLLSLRPDCKTLAMVAYQQRAGECLMVFNCENWTLLWKVQSNCAFIAGISWFPNSRLVFVWDSIVRFCVDFFHPDGSIHHTIAPTNATEDGIRIAKVSPCNSLFATFDENFQIRLYNTLTWRLVTIIDARKTENAPGISSDDVSRFLKWSNCSLYLAFGVSSTTHISIWSKLDGDSFNFVTKGTVSDTAWHLKKPTLAVATDSPHVLVIKCLQPETKVGCTKNIDLCTFESVVPVKHLQWEGASPSYLVVRKSYHHVAVTCIR